MLVTPRAKSIREAEKVFLIDLVEDGDSVCARALVRIRAGVPGNWYPYRDLHSLMEAK
jgi:hypothetical protein